MKKEEILSATVNFVQQPLTEAEGGHDWWHVYRAWKPAVNRVTGEPVDMPVVEMGALLHDIADSKFHKGDENIGPLTVRNRMNSLSLADTTMAHVVNIIRNISFKNGKEHPAFYSPEPGIVQDAVRLDAMEAIGIARAFNYGGFKNRALYDPAIKPNGQRTKEAYKNRTAPTSLIISKNKAAEFKKWLDR